MHLLWQPGPGGLAPMLPAHSGAVEVPTEASIGLKSLSTEEDMALDVVAKAFFAVRGPARKGDQERVADPPLGTATDTRGMPGPGHVQTRKHYATASEVLAGVAGLPVQALSKVEQRERDAHSTTYSPQMEQFAMVMCISSVISVPHSPHDLRFPSGSAASLLGDVSSAAHEKTVEVRCHFIHFGAPLWVGWRAENSVEHDVVSISSSAGWRSQQRAMYGAPRESSLLPWT